MTILVTGSAGHLGEALMRTFRSAGRDALGIDILASPFTDRVGSIADRAFVEKSMRGIRTVLHAATLHKPHVATHAQSGICRHQRHRHSESSGGSRRCKSRILHLYQHHQRFRLRPHSRPVRASCMDHRRRFVPSPKTFTASPKSPPKTSANFLPASAACQSSSFALRAFSPKLTMIPPPPSTYETANAQANELLYRRVDIEDVVSAHLLAVEKAPQIKFGRFIISATTPFTRDDLAALRLDAPAVVARHFPDFSQLYAQKKWKMFPQLDRVYVNQLAREQLGWRPKYDFRHVLESLRTNRDFRSELARQIGSKGYHSSTMSPSYPISR